jgi:hypothetical protein
VPGTYNITFTAQDPSLNTARVHIQVNILLNQEPLIRLRGNNPLQLEAGLEAEDPGASVFDPEEALDALLRSDFSTAADTSRLGTATVTYFMTANDKQGLRAPNVTRTVVSKDTLPPSITARQSQLTTLEAGRVWVDPGATAVDLFQGSVPVRVAGATVLSRPPTVPAQFQVIYTAEDSSGNGVSLARTVTVRDTLPPVLTAVAAAEVKLTVEERRHANATQFFRAEDLYEGDLTAQAVSNFSQVPTVLPANVTEAAFLVLVQVEDGSGNVANPLLLRVRLLAKASPSPAGPGTSSSSSSSGGAGVLVGAVAGAVVVVGALVAVVLVKRRKSRVNAAAAATASGNKQQQRGPMPPPVAQRPDLISADGATRRNPVYGKEMSGSTSDLLGKRHSTTLDDLDVHLFSPGPQLPGLSDMRPNFYEETDAGGASPTLRKPRRNTSTISTLSALPLQYDTNVPSVMNFGAEAGMGMALYDTIDEPAAPTAVHMHNYEYSATSPSHGHGEDDYQPDAEYAEVGPDGSEEFGAPLGMPGGAPSFPTATVQQFYEFDAGSPPPTAVEQEYEYAPIANTSPSQRATEA